ncbi:RraA family protein [Spongiimicrobium sp. 3-5]|uniref:RraA family protein n=1 Tax=Spongiimicrobium sp. 3-5 TaxID=3332596 RepID=UPI00397FA8E8
MNWKNDEELFALMRKELFSAVVGDVMDQEGYLHQFLPPKIQPLDSKMVVVGRAMPVLEADILEEQEANPVVSKPFGLMLEALDDLKKNEVYICSGASPTYALWGELMSTRAMVCGASGAVVNGFSRDTKGILELKFPTFSHGRYAQDQGPRGRVVDFRVPLKMDKVLIQPGDIVFGDLDGVCIIPQWIEVEVIHRALEKVRGEKMVQKVIEGGMSACEAFDRYGIM